MIVTWVSCKTCALTLQSVQDHLDTLCFPLWPFDDAQTLGVRSAAPAASCYCGHTVALCSFMFSVNRNHALALLYAFGVSMTVCFARWRWGAQTVCCYALPTTLMSPWEQRLHCLSVLLSVSEAVGKGLHALAASKCWNVFLLSTEKKWNFEQKILLCYLFLETGVVLRSLVCSFCGSWFMVCTSSIPSFDALCLLWIFRSTRRKWYDVLYHRPYCMHAALFVLSCTGPRARPFVRGGVEANSRVLFRCLHVLCRIALVSVSYI